MRITDLKQESDGEWIAISARMTWEERDHPEQRLCFEVGKSLADDVECNPHAFLVAAAVPAAYYGERRLLIEGRICPVLHDNVLTVLTQHREWYDRSRSLPVIEATRGMDAAAARPPRRAGQLFSGGIDAWATLRRNRLMYSADHPSSIRDCLHVFGLHPADYRDGAPCPARSAWWERNVKHLARVPEVAGVELHLLRTNAHGVFTDQNLQALEYHSASLLSLGHLLSRRLQELTIASSDYIGTFHPWGSHPLIDTYYSSGDLQIRHDGTRLTRLEKVRLVAEWTEALSLLNVCVNWQALDQGMNCGECDKCLRTLLALMICGRIDHATTFPVRGVDPQLVRDMKMLTGATETTFDDLLEPLARMGRQDLVDALKDRAAAYGAWLRNEAGHGWKPKIKRLDRKLFGGWVRNRWKRMKMRPAATRSSRS